MMKKAKFLTVFLTSAILLSGCKASENSDAVSVSTSTSETSTENSVVSSAVSSVESASSDVSTAISSSSTVISSVESTSTAPTEPTTSEPTSTTSEPTSTTSEPTTSEPAPEWTETPTSGTMYVNMSCFSRAKAVLGAEKVKQYFLNDAVTVTARATSASTGDIYYKIAEGEFIHSDYLSSSKIVIEQSDQTSSTPSGSNTTSSSNNNQPSSSGTAKPGDIKTENGKQYIYIGGVWHEYGGDAVQLPDRHDELYNPADNYIDPDCH